MRKTLVSPSTYQTPHHICVCGYLSKGIRLGECGFLYGLDVLKQCRDVVSGREKSWTLVKHKDLQKEPVLALSLAIQVE